MNTQSTASLIPSSSKQSQPQKDYSAAFGDLQSRYGMGVHVPCVAQSPAPSAPTTSNSNKWYKWRSSRSSSAASIVSTPSRTARPEKAYEAHLGQLMAQSGHGGGAFAQARYKQ